MSICIATYRRPAGLERLLASLERQKLPEALRCEVIVVDNDPEAHEECDASALREVRRIREPRRNIAHARNRAVEAARGEWLAFIDDDESAAEDWLASYWRRVEQGAADGYFGPVLAEPEGSTGRSLRFAACHARPRYPSGSPVSFRDVRTSNAFVRRALFRELRFDPGYGRSGGSDALLFRRALASGARFEWCDEAHVTEWVPPERDRVRWLLQRAFRGGVVHVRIERELGIYRPFRSTGVALCALPVCAAVAPLALPVDRVRALEWLRRAAVQLGKLWARVGGDYEEYRG